VKRLNAYSLDSLNVVQEDLDGFHVERESPQTDIAEKLNKHRVVSIGGLPGCGKSAILKRFAQNVASAGPVLFIKNDRIDASNWHAFATSLGLSNTDAVSLLQEIGSTGTPILFIDGIDRVRPDHQGVITDLVNKIAAEPSLSHWKVLVSSRDQGLEAFRACVSDGIVRKDRHRRRDGWAVHG
jgi:predicted AAA+ superfamily ATPase